MEDVNGRLTEVARVRPSAARLLTAVPLDIVTERLQGAPFDLVIWLHRRTVK